MSWKIANNGKLVDGEFTIDDLLELVRQGDSRLNSNTFFYNPQVSKEWIKLDHPSLLTVAEAMNLDNASVHNNASKSCPNCGAPNDSILTNCSYCGCPLPKLNSESTESYERACSALAQYEAVVSDLRTYQASRMKSTDPLFAFMDSKRKEIPSLTKMKKDILTHLHVLEERARYSQETEKVVRIMKRRYSDLMQKENTLKKVERQTRWKLLIGYLLGLCVLFSIGAGHSCYEHYGEIERLRSVEKRIESKIEKRDLLGALALTPQLTWEVDSDWQDEDKEREDYKELRQRYETTIREMMQEEGRTKRP